MKCTRTYNATQHLRGQLAEDWESTAIDKWWKLMKLGCFIFSHGDYGVEDPDAPGSGSDPNTAQTLGAQFTATFPS
jgi:hypothetical protein